MSVRNDLEAAHTAFQSGDLRAADTLCAEILKSAPNTAKAYQLRALIALKGNDILAAETHIKAALKIAPDDSECLNTYGNILKGLGRLDHAIAAYRKSLDVAPNYIQAAQHLGELYLIAKDPIKAGNVFEGALSHYPDNNTMQLGLLYALKDAQRTETAMQVLAELPQGPETALTAGQLLASEGRKTEAERAFRTALSHPPSASMAYTNLVQIIWLRDGYGAAVETIQTLIKTVPEAGFLYIVGADLLSQMDDNDAAQALLDQCEAKFGPQPDIDLARANSFIAQNRGEEAFALVNRALTARPGDIGLMPTFARAALMTKRFDLALDAAKNVQKFRPNDQFWIAIEATALRGLGRDHHRLYNYENFVRPYDLEAPPEYRDMDDFLGQLKTALMERQNNQHHPIGQSLRQGTQTSADLRFAESRIIQDFFQALARPIQDYLGQIGSGVDHPLTCRSNGTYRITGAWSVHLTARGFHVNHVHPEGWISSAFYVDVPEGLADDPDKKGWIKFGEPPFTVPGMGYEHIVAPKAGRLVLFPSYMWHGTVPISDNATRMTLPFDAVPDYGELPDG